MYCKDFIGSDSWDILLLGKLLQPEKFVVEKLTPMNPPNTANPSALLAASVRFAYLEL